MTRKLLVNQFVTAMRWRLHAKAQIDDHFYGAVIPNGGPAAPSCDKTLETAVVQALQVRAVEFRTISFAKRNIYCSGALQSLGASAPVIHRR